MPPKPDCCVVWGIGTRLGLQWSRGLVMFDYSDGDGFLGGCEGTNQEPPFNPTEVGGLGIQTEQSPLTQQNEVTPVETCTWMWPLSAQPSSTNCNHVMITWGDPYKIITVPHIVTLSPGYKPPSINSI